MNNYDGTIEMDEKTYFQINKKYGFDNIKKKYPTVRMSIYKKDNKMYVRNSSNIKLHHNAIMNEIKSCIFMVSPIDKPTPSNNILQTLINTIKPTKDTKPQQDTPKKSIRERKNIYSILKVEEADENPDTTEITTLMPQPINSKFT